MQEEIRFATFNVCNLAPAGAKLYDNLEPLSPAQYEAKAEWTARQIDLLDADVIGFQEIFLQAALRDVLSRTRHYRAATVAGYDAMDIAGRMLPTVALVSRLPLVDAGVAWSDFPAGVSISAEDNACRFARAPLHVQIILPGGQLTDVVVVHLKSRRPDYRHGDGNDAAAYALANLRSLQRRGAEAVALRMLASELGHSGRPRIVLGDFNDIANAVTTAIVMGAGAPCEPGMEMRARLYDANAIQLRQDALRHVGYTNIHDSAYMTIDHILVSEHFHPASPRAIGVLQEVTYLNDHLLLGLPHASDHGQVLARIKLLGNIH
ncbi:MULTISPECIES: endonuclease/exonuclease/phosphatase family protein [unclassified Janthinobacterium]|uniref:endonuclease/exonuclease/phosphatase family protein n=1 Tax=unclassified Janthinobacterium TaxID=2610881 RepID=UPI001E34C1C6|nr:MULTISPECIES: endonuclease/exonuclease/phosphatase family protein [unclassified Janthinobacterium]MCC7645172.1 endonuclease/exonuclease/phosphatase family protein [Janthinobacterium sp. EB271-G4-3-1]MCC7693559.1 endonuclease/exonuclease/phosphatase family protein [Janthinobacterium sp. EB271-G4-3-2]